MCGVRHSLVDRRVRQHGTERAGVRIVEGVGLEEEPEGLVVLRTHARTHSHARMCTRTCARAYMHAHMRPCEHVQATSLPAYSAPESSTSHAANRGAVGEADGWPAAPMKPTAAPSATAAPTNPIVA